MGITDWFKQQWEGLVVGAIVAYFGKDYLEKKISEYAEGLGRKIAQGMREQSREYSGQELKYKNFKEQGS
jgi:hypothetical protein